MTKIAINGFGRIGRMAMRAILQNNKKLEVVAVNDLTDNKTLAHLFEFDSTYGRFEGEVSSDEKSITINGQKIKALSERDPANLPWKDLEVDIVLECTGFFRHRDKAALHLKAGAKKVIISAPAKDEIDGTFVLGVNEKDFDSQKHHIISNASCTTNGLAPVAKVLHENFGIKKGLMTTIHSVTGDQKILDAPHSDLRRARACNLSMIPTTTGAAKAVALVLPELKGKLDGCAVRVSTPTVSLIDLTVQLNKDVSREEVNNAFQKASEGELKGILGFEEKPLVSSDFKMNNHSSIIDPQFTKVSGGNLLKVLAWYDNEWGYASRLVDLAEFVGS